MFVGLTWYHDGRMKLADVKLTEFEPGVEMEKEGELPLSKVAIDDIF